MPRPQFTLRTLLVLLLAVACFFGGMRLGERRGWERCELEHKADQERAALLAQVSAQFYDDVFSRSTDLWQANAPPYGDLFEAAALLAPVSAPLYPDMFSRGPATFSRKGLCTIALARSNTRMSPQ